MPGLAEPTPSDNAAPSPRSFSAPDHLCVAITGSSAEELIARSAAQAAVSSFQELRLDFLSDPLASLPALRAHCDAQPGLQLLATCRRIASGGRFSGTPEAEFEILLAAAQHGFSLLDLSIESAEALPADAIARLRATGATVLLSWHDSERTGDLAAVLTRMRRLRPDLGKIVPTATSLADNLTVLTLLRTAAEHPEPIPVVALAMGEAGIPSRVLGPRTGAPFTFAAPTPAEATAPGQLDAATLRTLYCIDRLTPATRVYGVAGDPIRSSLSPRMLNTAFAHTGEDAVYLPLLTHEPQDLFRFARELPLAGFSVTMPLKQAVLPFLKHIDPLAARIGAVNTVCREPDGSFSGFNTDAAGIIAPLEERLSLRNARVLVLGAGGAARAAVYACLDRGAQVAILNRTPAAATALAAESGAQTVTRADLPNGASFDVLINATPAGMRGNVTELPLAPDELHAALVFDLVYNPLDTPLLQAARAQGLQTISGVEMFLHQGARQFELWTGKPAPVDAMREAVLRALQEKSAD